jgi:HK97 family phage major capsid protein
MLKHRAFPGRGPEVEARYERAAQWLQASIFGNELAAEWCRNNGIPLRKAAAEGIGTAGGFLVPVELARAILDLRDLYGAFRRRARIWPMGSDHTEAPRHTGGSIAVGFIGEGAAAAETQATIDQVGLTARKLGALIRISTELEEDSAPAIVDLIANEAAFALAAKEDDCAFNGDGSSSFGRMYGLGQLVLDGAHAKAKVTAAAGHNTFLTLDSTDLSSLLAAVRASAIPNAAWFCSQTCLSQTFIRLAGGTGYLPMAESDGILTPHYLGFPVILTQKLPLVSTSLAGKVMLGFGDMYAAGLLGQRRGLTLARSADRYLDQDQVAILATERFHAVLHDLGDNSNTGSMAALVGGA